MSSQGLIVLPQNTGIQPAGVGLGVPMFRSKVKYLELVQPSSRQPNVKCGEFRVVSTNEHLGSTIKVVMLGAPQPMRDYFEGSDFKKENLKCFSIDGVRPHEHAREPQAMYCATCPKGDIMWDKWRKTRLTADLPKCGLKFKLTLADRKTQSPYFIDVKGKSVAIFQKAMKEQMAGIIEKLIANVKAINKSRGYVLAKVKDTEEGPVYEKFITAPGYVIPAGQTEQMPVEPMPNIFDISFDISARKDGAPFVMDFQNFMLMQPADRAEFGNLYLDVMERLKAVPPVEASAPVEEEEDWTETSGSDTPAPAQPAGEVLPPITI